MEVKEQVVTLCAEVLLTSASEIETDIEVAALGVDSILAAQLSRLINQAFKVSITPTILYECITIDGLAKYISKLLTENKTILLSQYKEEGIRGRRTIDNDAIVIVGMAGHFAGCTDLDAFWHVIEQGEKCLSASSRWRSPECDAYIGGFIDDYAEFDAAFFRISPSEARCMDPQQRRLLQTVQHAIDDSYLSVVELQSLQCGVFAASLPGDYKFVLAEYPEEAFSSHSFLGNTASTLSGRISYFYDFHGPSFSLDTACSSSLTALHEACLNIKSGCCQAAIVGAVSVFSTPELFQFAYRSNMASKQGECAAFAEEADGFTPAEGCAAIIVMRYEEARARGLRIYGAIAAIAINHDGKSNGLMAPNSRSQEKLIYELYQRHGIMPSELAYVETHGTGTRLGDPIEIRGLTGALGRIEENYDCYLGALKPLIGHTLVCSGMAGIIKVLLSFKHEIIPPFPAISHPNTLIDFGKFRMNSKGLPWVEGKFLCAVSAFGFAGSNGHVVLQKIPVVVPAQLQKIDKDLALPFCISAQNKNGLIRSAKQYRELIESIEEDKLYDLCQLMMRRPCYRQYHILIAIDKIDLLFKLEQLEHKLALGVEIVDSPKNPISAEMQSLVSLWISGVYDNLRYRLPRIDTLNLELRIPGYPFDAKRYWLGDNAEIITVVSPQENVKDNQSELVLSEIKISLSKLLGFSEEELSGDRLIDDLGLDSLSAIKLLAPYQRSISKIHVQDLFRYSSLSDLADAIAALDTDDHSSQLSRSPGFSVRDLSRLGDAESAEPDVTLGIQWVTHGHGENIVILAPPLNMGEEAWVQQINCLMQSGRRVLIPIYPGHQGSVFAEREFSLQWLADQFVWFIEQELQGMQVDLVGWSLGGCLSCLIAIKYPELLRSLTLISTAAVFNEDIFSNTLDLHDEFRIHHDILDVIFDRAEDIATTLGAGTPMNILRYYYDELKQFNVDTQLRDITVRTLLIHGENDCVVSNESFNRFSTIPNARKIMVEGHGHFIPLTTSRLFNTELISFLNESVITNNSECVLS